MTTDNTPATLDDLRDGWIYLGGGIRVEPKAAIQELLETLQEIADGGMSSRDVEEYLRDGWNR